jgi:hypothetical protein
MNTVPPLPYAQTKSRTYIKVGRFTPLEVVNQLTITAMSCKHVIGSLVRSLVAGKRLFVRYIRLAEHVIIYTLLS